MTSNNGDAPDSARVNGGPASIKCKQAQDWMQKHYEPPPLMALRFHGDASSGRLSRDDFDQSVDDDLLSHAKECDECKRWVTSVCGEDLMRRQRRLTEYCCPQLFGAIEEPRRDHLRIELEYYSPPNYEGAHNWRLTMPDSTNKRAFLLINYCPFCGKPIRIADSA